MFYAYARGKNDNSKGGRDEEKRSCNAEVEIDAADIKRSGFNEKIL